MKEKVMPQLEYSAQNGFVFIDIFIYIYRYYFYFYYGGVRRRWKH